jgi:mannosyltransferase OCH1-like enzyme
MSNIIVIGSYKSGTHTTGSMFRCTKTHDSLPDCEDKVTNNIEYIIIPIRENYETYISALFQDIIVPNYEYSPFHKGNFLSENTYGMCSSNCGIACNCSYSSKRKELIKETNIDKLINHFHSVQWDKYLHLNNIMRIEKINNYYKINIDYFNFNDIQQFDIVIDGKRRKLIALNIGCLKNNYKQLLTIINRQKTPIPYNIINSSEDKWYANIYKKFKEKINKNYPINSQTSSTITNIKIINLSYGIFDYTVEYKTSDSLIVSVKLLNSFHVKLRIINLNNELEYVDVTFDINNSVRHVDTPFILEQKTNPNSIPRIIHQSYLSSIKYNMYKVISTWRMMNPHYKYMYWNDNDCIAFIKNNFDDKVLEAYEMLYAGAYKSDIFRLCVLIKFGGIWTDISSRCMVPIDKLISNHIKNVFVIDNGSQRGGNGNIYQAFIGSNPDSNILKYILNFTVDKVLNHESFDNKYPQLVNQSVAVTGPTIFSMALNIYFNRKPLELHSNSNTLSSSIIFLNHPGRKITKENRPIIITKYNYWGNDRSTKHYSSFFQKGYVYKKKINNQDNKSSDTVFQVWIQSRYVSKKMLQSINTIKNIYKNYNYKLITENDFYSYLENDHEFPLLKETYDKIKPYAFKADIIRYYLLYRFGGIYIDIDFIGISNFNNLFNNYDIIFTIDLGDNILYNGFIAVKKHGHLFFKFVLEQIILEVNSNKVYTRDLEITGPILFTKCFYRFFNVNNFNISDKKYYFLKHVKNLPYPGGSWLNSSRNIKIINNTLTCECKRINRKWVYQSTYFLTSDIIHNKDGKLCGATNINYTYRSSRFIIDKKTVLFATKYEGYNDERFIMGGNDYATMFKNNDYL